jgi:peptidoglycan/xylan/chitin deacetylase (PgdA/CDA1 family)
MRPLFAWLSPAGPGARLSVLIFHRVLARPDPLFPGEVDGQTFDAICRWLRHWFEVLPLDRAVQALRDGTLPARAAAITFDDGYADNHDLAMPILQRHGLSATFFVASGFLDGGWMWNDGVIDVVRRSERPLATAGIGEIGADSLVLDSLASRRDAIRQLIGAIKHLDPARRLQIVQALQQRMGLQPPQGLMMTTEQLRGLRRGGMGIGAHTVNHPILARLADDAARREIAAGRDRLQDLLQERVPLFAYPNGQPASDYSTASVRLVQEAGFDAAFSTAWGAAAAGADVFQLPRFTPWDRTRTRFGLRLLRNLRQPARPATVA